MANKLLRSSFALLAVLCGLATACMRGGISSDPPVHLVLDMDFQPKLRTQAETDFEGWADHRASRLPVNDPVSTDPLGKTLVVARGSLPNPALANRDAAGNFVKQNPLSPSAVVVHRGREMTVIERGRERFDIHCAVCHGYSGQGGNGPTGHGLIGRRWPAVIPTFHFQSGEGKDNRVPLMPEGEYFEVVTYGKNTMPAYGARLSPEDRWAIVHYVRALQSLSK
jgi:mono/diheme cytochrome c family protein